MISIVRFSGKSFIRGILKRITEGPSFQLIPSTKEASRTRDVFLQIEHKVLGR